MILQTPRLILRPWRTDDAEALFACASDPRVGPPAGWLAHRSVAESLDVIQTVFNASGTYAIVWKESDEIIGSIGLLFGSAATLPLGRAEAELGYWLSAPLWGQGIIPEACQELLRYGFQSLHLCAVWCGYYDGNIRSFRVQQKCGFRPHHTVFEQDCPLLNCRQTVHYALLTRRRWRLRRLFSALFLSH